MAEAAELRAAKHRVRERERAIWTEVEKVGRELRAQEAAKLIATATQAEQDARGAKPRERSGV